MFLRLLPVKCGRVVAVDMLHLSSVHKRQGRIILLGIRTHNSSRFYDNYQNMQQIGLLRY